MFIIYIKTTPRRLFRILMNANVKRESFTYKKKKRRREKKRRRTRKGEAVTPRVKKKSTKEMFVKIKILFKLFIKNVVAFHFKTMFFASML